MSFYKRLQFEFVKLWITECTKKSCSSVIFLNHFQVYSLTHFGVFRVPTIKGKGNKNSFEEVLAIGLNVKGLNVNTASKITLRLLRHDGFSSVVQRLKTFFIMSGCWLFKVFVICNKKGPMIGDVGGGHLYRCSE